MFRAKIPRVKKKTRISNGSSATTPAGLTCFEYASNALRDDGRQITLTAASMQKLRICVRVETDCERRGGVGLGTHDHRATCCFALVGYMTGSLCCSERERAATLARQ